MRIMREKIKKYLPDILIIVGAWLALQPRIYDYTPRICLKGTACNNYTTDWDKIGIIVILIGIDVLVRRYLITKKRGSD